MARDVPTQDWAIDIWHATVGFVSPVELQDTDVQHVRSEPGEVAVSGARNVWLRVASVGASCAQSTSVWV
jgi:hypothetical protein